MIRIVAVCFTCSLAFGVVLGQENGGSIGSSSGIASLVVTLIMAVLPADFGVGSPPKKRKRGSRDKPIIERTRKYVNDIFKELGPSYVRRAYRMDAEAFWNLHRLLKPHMVKDRAPRVSPGKKGAVNGLITTPVRLSCALRYCAGGRPEDIALVHGISHTEVFRSLWYVVDAVNACQDAYLSLSFPEDHEKQRAIAKGFEKKSRAGFNNCCGATDGMLVWMEKPGEEECIDAGCGPKKFLCGRKGKFGLNLQGTCDADRKFLDVQVHHPASTSDFLSFSTSSLYRKLETKGFLADGLCIYGDSAYVNCLYLATPFKSVSSGSKDDYNFYHSQLRINIECAFGMFVKRWGVLRKALPAKMELRKITALLICLCKLHNYCIEWRLRKKEVEVVVAPVAADNLDIVANGGISLVATSDNTDSPEEFLNGGEHWEDTSETYRKQFARRGLEDPSARLPREHLLGLVEAGGFKRPRPKGWASKKNSNSK